MNLRLFQFRCHGELQLELPAGRHFFFGANGQGKTSILEAVYFLSRLKSFRTAQTRELVAWQRDCLRVEAQIGDTHLSATWSPTNRELAIDRKAVASAAEFWGRIATVLFIGEDRALVTGSGAGRRNWVDSLIAQCDPDYLAIAQNYQRALRQRNAWLRQGAADARLGESLTQLVTEHGLAVTQARRAITEPLASAVATAIQNLSAQRDTVTLRYRPNFTEGQTPDWNRVVEGERRFQTTLLGPHRDDWILERDGHPLGKFGSEGQQRTAALALRLAEAQLIRERRGQWPILLMDDVAPQLDESRQSALRSLLPTDAMILITAPEDRGWTEPVDYRWRIEPSYAKRIE
jgi:DNA replication and repair protein RecF